MEADLHHLADDMKAFIEGHGMRRFAGYVGDEVQSVMWGDGAADAEGWKDFVELAKGSGAPFITINAVVLEREDIDEVVDRLRNSAWPNEEEIEDARWLRTHVGKTGFVQLGFPFQGTMFLYEISTDWYDRYQRLVDVADEYGGFVIDEREDDDPLR